NRPQIRVTGSISKVPTPRSPESLSNMRSRLSARRLRPSEALSKGAFTSPSRREARPSISESIGRFLKTIKTLALHDAWPKRFRQTAIMAKVACERQPIGETFVYGLLTAIKPPGPGEPEPDDYPRNRARCNRCSFRRRGRIHRNFSTIRSREPDI